MVLVTTMDSADQVESAALKNFLCHVHLGPILFGPKIKLGSNDASGKS